jgi:hypothetical protein
MVVSGFIASLFIARDELHYDVVQMVVAVILFTLIVFICAFWPKIKNWLKKLF